MMCIQTQESRTIIHYQYFRYSFSGWVLKELELEEPAQSRDHLTKLLREEEIKYYQHAKVKDVLLGDNNTRYFQMVANGKHRKKRIFSLDDDSGKIKGQANLKAY